GWSSGVLRLIVLETASTRCRERKAWPIVMNTGRPCTSSRTATRTTAPCTSPLPADPATPHERPLQQRHAGDVGETVSTCETSTLQDHQRRHTGGVRNGFLLRQQPSAARWGPRSPCSGVPMAGPC